ncbi:AraC family transcriptional regulator [Sodalis sp. RH21]|uniref:AraC family transcriptional regulator n=1 Tax=unclassified Sodalis (in: enterobacteria) TaxID=2636512 RepID=UPI0039B672E0
MFTQSLLSDFDPDSNHCPAVALGVQVTDNLREIPVHRHRKGQLILTLRGSVTCSVPDALWMVPPQRAVWIPGGLSHSNRVTANTVVCFLFVEPGAALLPDRCCTLSMSPLLRELILRLSRLPPVYQAGSFTGRLVTLLLEELVQMPHEHLNLPIPRHPTLRRMADILLADPANRGTLAQWAQQSAMSERSLARLIVRETGLTFGRWRQQLHLIIALGHLSDRMPVQQVAEKLGYDSVTAFITMFKKSLGTSPGHYFSGEQRG